MPTEFPNQKPKRRRYRTRMFDEPPLAPRPRPKQVRQLQAESDAAGRSVASLIREAIDEFLPRLRRAAAKASTNPPGAPCGRRPRPTFPSSGPCGGS